MFSRSVVLEAKEADSNIHGLRQEKIRFFVDSGMIPAETIERGFNDLYSSTKKIKTCEYEKDLQRLRYKDW